MRSSGRRPIRINSPANAASARRTAAITIASTLRSRVRVWAASLSGTAMIISPEPVSLVLARTRYCTPEPATESTVISLGCARSVVLAICAGSFGGDWYGGTW